MLPRPTSSRIHIVQGVYGVMCLVLLCGFVFFPWQYVVGTYAVLTLVLLLIQTTNDWWIHRDPAVRKAIAAARDQLSADDPELKAINANLRAAEADRFVIAVIYESPTPYRGRPPYKLYAVARKGLQALELPRDLDSPYRITGVK